MSLEAPLAASTRPVTETVRLPLATIAMYSDGGRRTFRAVKAEGVPLAVLERIPTFAVHPDARDHADRRGRHRPPRPNLQETDDDPQ